MGKAFETTIKRYRFYLLEGDLVKIIYVSKKNNRVIVNNFSKEKNEAIELDTAPNRLTPLFAIGEVGRMLDYAPATLRKYERLGHIPVQKQYDVGKRKIRLYKQEDIQEIAILLAQRPPVGRPADVNPVSKIDRKRLETGIRQRIKEVKKINPNG